MLITCGRHGQGVEYSHNHKQYRSLALRPPFARLAAGLPDDQATKIPLAEKPGGISGNPLWAPGMQKAYSSTVPTVKLSCKSLVPGVRSLDETILTILCTIATEFLYEPDRWAGVSSDISPGS